MAKADATKFIMMVVTMADAFLYASRSPEIDAQRPPTTHGGDYGHQRPEAGRKGHEDDDERDDYPAEGRLSLTSHVPDARLPGYEERQGEEDVRSHVAEDRGLAELRAKGAREDLAEYCKGIQPEDDHQYRAGDETKQEGNKRRKDGPESPGERLPALTTP